MGLVIKQVKDKHGIDNVQWWTKRMHWKTSSHYRDESDDDKVPAKILEVS